MAEEQRNIDPRDTGSNPLMDLLNEIPYLGLLSWPVAGLMWAYRKLTNLKTRKSNFAIFSFLAHVAWSDGAIQVCEKEWLEQFIGSENYGIGTLDDILATAGRGAIPWKQLKKEPITHREQLVLLGLRLASVDGQITIKERALLKEACLQLGVDPDKLIKTAKKNT